MLVFGAAPERFKPTQLCQVWASLGRSDRTLYVFDGQKTWCEAYHLSPESCGCLSNAGALKRQAAAIEAACSAASPADPDRVMEDAQRECGVVPPRQLQSDRRD
jgi:hypothetical protein